ncbi:hypothetical protein OH77DRAFT_1499485 [Trametes cingulata]|nr:hypothetical protein OH77DRAFT_1499485 [Trametes cingulata]
MLDIAVKYRDTVDSPWSACIQLTAEEWKLAEELQDILKDTTLFFSRDTPNLAMVIPAMDHIDTGLTNHSHDNSVYEPCIRSALRLTKKMPNRYYRISDMSATYCITMGKLSPSWPKLKYFEQARWPRLWQKTALNMAHEEFDTH